MKIWILFGIMTILCLTSCEKDNTFTEQHQVTYKIIVYDFDEELKYKLDDPSEPFSMVTQLGVCETSMYKTVGELCFMEVACKIRDERVEFVMQILVNGIEMKSFHYSSDHCGDKSFEMKYILFSNQVP